MSNLNGELTSKQTLTANAYVGTPVAGGGVTSWNDLKDKPFGEKEVSFLDEQTITLADMDGLTSAFITPNRPLVDGSTYIVKWGNTEYECVCERDTVFYIGNALIFGGNDTGEPFVIGDVGDENGFILIALDGATEITISVVAKEVQPLDGKYIPFDNYVLDLGDYSTEVVNINGASVYYEGVGFSSSMIRAIERGCLSVRFTLNGKVKNLDTVNAYTYENQRLEIVPTLHEREYNTSAGMSTVPSSYQMYALIEGCIINVRISSMYVAVKAFNIGNISSIS